ncbi:hypothetical protein Btru_032187 [Bulinus truncatus]|nr:hypothetical protein Btru_032187 [Bulinus truncatus]
MTRLFQTNEIHPNKLTEDIMMVHISSSRSFDQMAGQQSTGLSRIFSKFADKTSLNGVPFIKSSSMIVAKLIWSLVLAAAIGAMIFHLYSLFKNFFAFNKHSQIDLSFSKLPFPAVTLCNVNIMRASQENKASQSLRDIINEMNPQEMVQKAMTWSQTNSFEGDGQRKDNFLDTFSLSSNFSLTKNQAENSFYSSACDDCWESESDSSSSSSVEASFREEFSYENETIRNVLGHQIDDMLLQCSFAGRKCFWSNFTRIHSANYGNCYTLQYSKFISRKSGPEGGLELTFYLETEEYIPGISNGKGMQIVIHEQGTIPFPKDEGLAVSAGFQTFIGLRMIEVSRLGEPYSPCTSTDNFVSTYNKTYTRNTCQKICQETKVREACKCYDHSELELYDVMKNPKGLPPCRNTSELMCLSKEEFEFDATESSCNCNNPCREKIYEKTLAARQWPSKSHADLLIQAICQKIPNDLCKILKNKNDSDKLEDFIKVNIYFEDLNYEELSEKADYELTQLLSDIGGSIGLWIGLSVLSMFELFHLVTDIMFYLCWAKWHKH